ncbi:MAG: hypothetical protein MH208_17555 [Marinobacter sp.]|nr:hypothetical protein [Marinobacter sp.]
MLDFNKISKCVALASGVVSLSLSSMSHAFDFKAGESDVSIYGYAKLDMIYDIDADLGNSAGLSKVRLDGVDGSDGHMTMHALQKPFRICDVDPYLGQQVKKHELRVISMDQMALFDFVMPMASGMGF